MISLEEKLYVFTQYLLKKQRDWGKKNVDLTKSKCDRLYKESDDKLKSEIKHFEARNAYIIERDKNKIISQTENDGKTQFLEEKSQIFDDFLKSIIKQSRSFVGTDIYYQYMERCVRKIPSYFGENKEILLYANKEERAIIGEFTKRVLPDYKIYFDVLKSHYIGGFVARDIHNRINCDFSVRNLVQDNKKLIGIRLVEMMEKQVN